METKLKGGFDMNDLEVTGKILGIEVIRRWEEKLIVIGKGPQIFWDRSTSTPLAQHQIKW